jgi:hypothetical protein
MAQGPTTYGLHYGVNPPAIVRTGEPDHGSLSVRLSRNAEGPAPDRRDSVRNFHLLAEDGTQIARVTTEQPLGSRLSGRPAIYHVLDPYGAPLGRIALRRRRAFRLGRKRWTVEPVGGPVLHGYQGRLVWWVLFWTVGLPFYLMFLIMVLLGGDGDGPGLPRRIIWRDPSHRAHLVFRAVAEEYQLLRPDLDPRLINALIGLHQSFDRDKAATGSVWY